MTRDFRQRGRLSSLSTERRGGLKTRLYQRAVLLPVQVDVADPYIFEPRFSGCLQASLSRGLCRYGELGHIL